MGTADYPLVSIVNVSWNGRTLLEKHLPSLKNLKYPNYEVIIVDNGSSDESAEFVREKYPEFRLIQNKTNLGTAEGSNVAIKEAKGKYIFWVSNDMEFAPDILDHLVQRCENDLSVGICTVKMLRIKNGKCVNEIDSVGAKVDIFGFPISRGINEPDKGQYNYPAEIFFSFGGAMFIRKEVLNITGGFDPDYLTLADDIDLSWRVHLAGYRVMAEPKSFLYHRVSATLSKSHNRAQKRYISERNTLRTLLKNYSLFSLFCIMPFYLLILLGEMIFFFAVGRPKIAQSGMKAVFWNITHLKETLNLRKKVQVFRKVGDRLIMKLMLKRPEKVRLFFDFLFNRQTERWSSFF